VVWQAAGRENFVADVQAMRRRVEASVTAARAARQNQAGARRAARRGVRRAIAGSLVHGRARSVAARAQHAGRAARVTAGGYVGRDDAGSLAEALPVPAHAGTSQSSCTGCGGPMCLPDATDELRRLGRSMGCAPTRQWRSPRRGSGTRSMCGGCTRSCSTGRLLLAVARLPREQARLTPEAARTQMAALGYADPAGAFAPLGGVDLGVVPPRGHSAHVAAGDAGLVRGRGRPGRGPVCRSVRSPTRWARRRGTCACCVTRAWRPSGCPGCWPPVALPPICWAGPPEAVSMLASDDDLTPRHYEARCSSR